ncbi:dynactin Arp1 p62 subunit RO2 [Xylariaceae sp. FL0804]|nr:dynactin Arp1 p62 subunit RO2 [Xylariaceae sp. FL0804]
MASFTPYTYIQCPCHDDPVNQARQPGEDAPSPTAADARGDDHDDDDGGGDDRTFDPRAPRSSYSLYPLEYLNYCEECHQIRCPRCVSEELVTIYCPNCLFEVGSSSLKTEGNRCTRSCFQCPICVGPLSVQSLESAPEPSLLSAENASSAPAGPWILTCSYCNWSSSEIGIKFDKPSAIFSQLQKLRYGEEQSAHALGGDTSTARAAPVPETQKARFAALRSFYAAQEASANPSSGLSGLAGLGDLGFKSPGALSRIMNIYSGNSTGLKQKTRPTVMREADAPGEGFRPSDLDDSEALTRLRRDGWDGTVTVDQARAQVDEGARFADELWPVPYLLRAKRSKRCPVCRHIISKPESKVNNTRWRIRLVANAAIPSISVRPLLQQQQGSLSGSSASTPLRALQPVQYLLTFKNPRFEDVRVTLATPAVTPGRFASRVTVLCPTFHIDANTDTDMYLDDVLRDGSSSGGGGVGGDRSSRRRTHHGHHHDGGDAAANATQQQAEPGKVWERGRNWVSVVVEVVPAPLMSLEAPPPALLRRDGDGAPPVPPPDLGPLREDEDVLEIPMFVRLEWEGDASAADGGGGGRDRDNRDRDAKEKKEVAYWCAIGIGRIAQG